MFPSARLGLLALLRSIRYIGLALKSFILRCLFFQSRVPHNLRRILSLCSRTGPKDVPEKARGQATRRPSFPRASGGCDGYSAIHTSRDFNRASEPHLPLGPGNAEVLHLSPMMAAAQSQSPPQSPASSRATSLCTSSPRPSDRQHTSTHSRVTSSQFAGAFRLDRSRSPSPSPFPHPLPMPLSSTLESPGGTQIPDVSPIPRGTTLRSRESSIDIRISPPSRSHFPTAGSPSSTPSLPQSFTSQVSVGNISVGDALGAGSDGRVRSIRLMHSDQVSRYVNKGVSSEYSEYRLHPMQVDLPRYSYQKCPQGWVPAMHPGGALYFHNPERRIFTDVYMYDFELSAEIHSFMAILDTKRARFPNDFPTDHYDLVLDILKMENDETVWAYYYVDHNTKTLFWLHFYECGDDMLSDVCGVQEGSHVKLRLESLYWTHWSLYPADSDRRRFPGDASKELLGALLSSGIDSLTSKISTSPYTVAEIESMRDFIKDAERLGPGNPHVITSVARLLSFYAYWRFLHFHGQKVSHHDRYKSIYKLKGSRPKHTILVRILSPILFFFPKVHLLELEKMWRGNVIVEALWKAFMQKLVSQWTEFVLYSTVMLAANVAFLAVPGVIVIPQNTRIKPSPAQIASSISLVFSIGSIITGLLLIQHNHMMTTKNPKNAWHYLHGIMWPVVGLELLAIVFSLTYALLMWSVWGFFVALLLFTFQDTSGKIWIIVGTAAGIVTTLIVWCIKYTWDPKGREEERIDWPFEPGPQVRTSLRQDSLESMQA